MNAESKMGNRTPKVCLPSIVTPEYKVGKEQIGSKNGNESRGLWGPVSYLSKHRFNLQRFLTSQSVQTETLGVGRLVVISSVLSIIIWLWDSNSNPILSKVYGGGLKPSSTEVTFNDSITRHRDPKAQAKRPVDWNQSSETHQECPWPGRVSPLLERPNRAPKTEIDWICDSGGVSESFCYVSKDTNLWVITFVSTQLAHGEDWALGSWPFLLPMEARIAQLVKAWICNLRIVGSSPTVGGPLASLSLQIASVGSDHHTKKMEVPTRGLGSKSLHGCKRSTSFFSLRAAEFRRVKCKLSA